FLVQIARAERRDGDDGLGVHIAHAALVALLGEQRVKLFAHFDRAAGRGREEGAVAVVRGVVFLDKVADVDRVLPSAAIEGVPCVHVICSSWFWSSCPFLQTRKGSIAYYLRHCPDGRHLLRNPCSPVVCAPPLP